MKRFAWMMAACLLAAPAAFAQSGAITPAMLAEMKTQLPDTQADRAINRAVAVNGLKAMVNNLENPIPNGTHFTYEVKSNCLTDQKGSGRCWLFTGLNVLRSQMINKYNLSDDFMFSQAYIFFYDQLEKCNLFLQCMLDNASKPLDDRKVEWQLKNPLSDGGTFMGVADLVTKYGVVPASAMPETFCANNTSTYAMLMKMKLREDALRLREMAAAGKKAKDLEQAKKAMLTEVYAILVRCFGMPPEKFSWNKDGRNGSAAREYTPKQFYEEYLANDLKGGYMMFMNDPTRPYYKTYEIDLDRHSYDGTNWVFLNLPMKEIKDMAIASLKDTTMLYMSCDVGKYYNSKAGYSDEANFNYGDILNTSFNMDKRERIMTFASASTHAMTLKAVDLDDQGNPQKWMVENSWGASSGYKGQIIMSDSWFDGYMFRLVVAKKYIPENLMKMATQKPTLLPAWDPLFTPEE